MEKQVGITVKKSDDFSEWYTQVIQKAELADYTKVSGCIVFRPRAYEIWETIADYFDKKIKKMGFKNAYFPLFIPESLLKKEAEHVEGFAPEVAWVTHAGKSKLQERIAVRPTSETIMYDSYKDWVQSYRDLPIKINQWCSVVRWEFKHPVPFLRTREFLWQEGHTAYATREEAVQETHDILDIYEDIFENFYAIPVLKGRKSDKEKFAGADFTNSVEMLMPNGKAIQGATTHMLGQNFAKAFDISFIDENEKKQYVWQNSWAITTRSIGIMIMVHGDDKGLVIPPKVAVNKVVIVPIVFKGKEEIVMELAKKVHKQLATYGAMLDDREGYTPGWKFNEWEMKGVPLRVEIGPKDVEKSQVVVVRRDNGKKQAVALDDLKGEIPKILDAMQDELFKKAKKFLDESIVEVHTFSEMKKALSSGKIAYGLWCGGVDCEEQIKDKTGGAKSLNIPFGQTAQGECVHCKAKAACRAYFAKSY